MKKKIFIPILISAVIAIGFILYSILSNVNFSSPTEIQFRITWEQHSARGVAINNIIEKYNESQTKVYVTLIGGNEDKDDYMSSLTMDETDVYMVPYRYIRSPEIASEFIEVTDLYMEHESQYYETIKQLTKSDGSIVAVPWIGHSMALIYNKNIVEEAGVNPEEFTSLDDLLYACEVIYEKTGKSGLGLIGANSHDLTWMMSQFIYTFNGSLVERDIRGNQTAVTINTNESIAAIDFYVNRLGKYAQQGWQEHTGSEVIEAFRNEEIAFEIQGPWGITDVWKCGCDFEARAISLAQMGMYSEVGPLMLSISKDSPNIESAKDFVNFLMEKRTLEAIMEGEYDDKYEAYYPYRVPLRMDMEDSSFFEKYPEFLVFIKGYEMPSINTPTTIWAMEYKDLYAYYVNKAIIGDISIQQALEYIEGKKQID